MFHAWKVFSTTPRKFPERRAGAEDEAMQARRHEQVGRLKTNWTDLFRRIPSPFSQQTANQENST
jgi:hypothetical protein